MPVCEADGSIEAADLVTIQLDLFPDERQLNARAMALD